VQLFPSAVAFVVAAAPVALISTAADAAGLDYVQVLKLPSAVAFVVAASLATLLTVA